MEKFTLELGHYERIEEQCRMQYRNERGETYLTQYVLSGFDKLTLLVNRESGACTKIICRDGSFAQFPGIEYDGALTEALGNETVEEKVKHGVYIVRLSTGWLFQWVIQLAFFDPGDEDGFGMDSEPEIRLYSYLDEDGRFTAPFRLYSVGGTGYYREQGEEKKVIFLDFDGVLNSERYLEESYSRGVALDPTRLALLRELVYATDSRIVLTTSWREHWSIVGFLCDDVGNEISRLFHDAGMYIDDKTPGRLRNRYEEIAAWLQEHPEVKQYVVLDDEPYEEGILRGHFVLTCGLRDRRGLDEDDVKKALRILGGSDR